jgi:hypothetical protein
MKDIDTRTWGEAEEDARAERSYRTTSYRFTPQRRNREWWQQFNAARKEQGTRNTLHAWAQGRTPHGTGITAGYLADLERSGFVVCEGIVE